MKKIAVDLLFPDMGKVPIQNSSRGNRGCSFGFTGNQGCLTVGKSKTAGLSKPVLMRGTLRYQQLFLHMTQLLELMLRDQNLPQPFVDHGIVGDLNESQERLELFANVIHPENKLESISVLCMIDDSETSPEVNDVLHEHRDVQNCSNKDGTIVWWYTKECLWILLGDG